MKGLQQSSIAIFLVTGSLYLALCPSLTAFGSNCLLSTASNLSGEQKNNKLPPCHSTSSTKENPKSNCCDRQDKDISFYSNLDLESFKTFCKIQFDYFTAYAVNNFVVSELSLHYIKQNHHPLLFPKSINSFQVLII